MPNEQAAVKAIGLTKVTKWTTMEASIEEINLASFWIFFIVKGIHISGSQTFSKKKY